MEETNLQLITENLNAILGKHTENGFIIITSYRNEKTIEKNKEDFEILKKTITKYGFSYIPVFGTSIEKDKISGEEKRVMEPSLFVPNYIVGSSKSYPTDDAIKELGMVLTKRYNQDTFLFKPRGKDNNVYLMNGDGEIELIFSSRKINDMYEKFFTALEKNTYEKGKKIGLGKKTNRFSYTDVLEYYIQTPPSSIGDAAKRYGEIFFNLKK